MNETHRPCYHFTAPRAWLNDPNGLVQHNGVYHLFYQHNPADAFWADMHWGHAASQDLFHWEDRPIALVPDQPYDSVGVFSGVCIIDGATPTIIYTAIGPDRPSVARATGDAQLNVWVKDPANPLIALPPEVHELSYRDHTVWREGDRWHMFVGAGLHNGSGAVLHYRSTDLRAWDYLGVACAGDAESGSVWECPDFFLLEGTAYLIISPIPTDRAIYMSGGWDGARFTPERRGEIDLGGSLYAPQSFADESGRRVMFGWLREERPREAQVADDWSGAMSLPRELFALDGGALGQRPVAEVERLRRDHFALTDVPLSDERRALPPTGDAIEIVATLHPGDAARCGVIVRCTPDHSEQTIIAYDRERAAIVIDRSQSSADSAASALERSAPLLLGEDEPLRLRVFVDRSVIEVFANDRVCLASRVYPSSDHANGIALLAQGGAAVCDSVDVYHIASSMVR